MTQRKLYDIDTETFNAKDATLVSAMSCLHSNAARYGKTLKRHDAEVTRELAGYHLDAILSHIAECATRGRFDALAMFTIQDMEHTMMRTISSGGVEFVFGTKIAAYENSWFIDDSDILAKTVECVVGIVVEELIARGFHVTTSVHETTTPVTSNAIRYEVRMSWGNTVSQYSYKIMSSAQIEALRHGISANDIFL